MALLTASGCGQESAGTGWTGSPLEFRIAYNDPQEGFWAVKYRGDTIYLTPWASLTEGNIESLGLERQGDKVILTAIVYAGMADRLAEVTGRNVGNQLAVLVDGEVRAVSRIESRFAGGNSPLQLSFDMSRREADAFAMAIRARRPVRRRPGSGP